MNIGLIHTKSGVTVLAQNKTVTISPEDPRYDTVIEAYGNKDEAALLAAMKPVAEKIRDIVQGTGVFEYSPTEIKYMGKPIHGVLVNKIKQMISQGAPDLKPLQAFLERLFKNPSATSIDELYTFLEYKQLPITPDGYFLAYRGVQNDYYSCHGNKNTIVKQGVVNSEFQILNSIGATIEVDRNQVDDNRNVHCSFGLHAGSFDYAKSFGQRVLVVKIDPADVVSVPNDCNCQKARVCKFEVISEYEVDRDEMKEIPAAVVTVEQAKAPTKISAASNFKSKDNQIIQDRIEKYLTKQRETGYTHVTLKSIQSCFSPSCPPLLTVYAAVSKMGYKIDVDKEALGSSYVKTKK